MSTFPQAPLDARVEIDLNGTWTDVTSYVLQREGTSAPIAISRGRPDESSQVNPATMSLQLNNRDGRFSVKNPAGPYYGLLTRNTPIRVSVPSQTTYLRMADDTTSYASAPSSSGLNPTGDLELQIDAAPDGWSTYAHTIVLANKWVSSGQFSWYLEVLTNGNVRFWRSTTGSDSAFTDSTMPLPLGRSALKVTYATSTGTVTYYTAPTISGGWTQLGSAVTISGGGTIFASTAPVWIGQSANSMTGSVFGFKLLSGIGGTVKASPDFTAQTAGASSFADAQGNTWTMNGTAQISQRAYRFHGEMSSLPVAWDTSGKDVWVPLAAGGLLRRLSQGNAPLDSALKRALLSQTGTLAPVAYWPCEDLQGSTEIGSAIGGPPMSISGGTGDGSVTTSGPAFASDDSFLCSDALPTINGSVWVGYVPRYTSSGSIIVRFPLKVGTVPPNGTRIVRVITTGTCTELAFYYSLTGGVNCFGLAGYNASGTVFDSGAINFASTFGDEVWISMELRPGSGTTVNWSLITLLPGASSGLEGLGSFTGSIGNATAVYVNPYGGGFCTDVTLGHISVQSDWESLFNLGQPFNAWQGETAGSRFARLCSENGIAARVYGPPDTTAPMGAQSPETLTQLLQECEDADRGMIYEPRQALALAYRTYAALLNQDPAVTADYSQSELAGDGGENPIQPTTDDQYTRNDWTLTRGSGQISGANYRYQLDDGSPMSISPPPDGVGDYADSTTLNVEADSQIQDLAGWMVHLGTVDEARWPVLPFNMARPVIVSSAGLFYGLAGVDVGDYVAISNPPAWLPPDQIKQLIPGITETLGGFFWLLSFTGIPESPYETAVLDDPVYGRADTDGSTLASAATSTATTLSVATVTGEPIWTTSSGDFPFDIAVAGERITVTSITGASSPQTFHVTRSVNGVVKSHTAGEDVRLWFPPILAIL